MTATHILSPVKTCTKCKESKPATLDVFPPHKMGKYGLHPNCRPCKKITDAALREKPDQLVRQQKWRDLNKEKVRETNAAYRADGHRNTEHEREAYRAWYLRNIDRARKAGREQQKRSRLKNPERHKEVAQRSYSKNKDVIIARLSNKYRSEPAFNLRVRLAASLRAMLKMDGGKRGRSTEELLGYTCNELRAHIEKQFVRGMTWSKYLAGEIHIDHIRPLVSAKTESDVIALNQLANLRPMWAFDNMSKGAQITHLI